MSMLDELHSGFYIDVEHSANILHMIPNISVIEHTRNESEMILISKKQFRHSLQEL